MRDADMKALSECARVISRKSAAIMCASYISKKSSMGADDMCARRQGRSVKHLRLGCAPGLPWVVLSVWKPPSLHSRYLLLRPSWIRIRDSLGFQSCVSQLTDVALMALALCNLPRPAGTLRCLRQRGPGRAANITVDFTAHAAACGYFIIHTGLRGSQPTV